MARRTQTAEPESTEAPAPACCVIGRHPEVAAIPNRVSRPRGPRRPNGIKATVAPMLTAQMAGVVAKRSDGGAARPVHVPSVPRRRRAGRRHRADFVAAEPVVAIGAGHGPPLVTWIWAAVLRRAGGFLP
jgi:hypothetical protein